MLLALYRLHSCCIDISFTCICSYKEKTAGSKTRRKYEDKNHSCFLSYALAYLMHLTPIIMQQGRDSYPTFLSSQLRSTLRDRSFFIFSAFLEKENVVTMET